jgi:hypothetical protein
MYPENRMGYVTCRDGVILKFSEVVQVLDKIRMMKIMFMDP